MRSVSCAVFAHRDPLNPATNGHTPPEFMDEAPPCNDNLETQRVLRALMGTRIIPLSTIVCLHRHREDLSSSSASGSGQRTKTTSVADGTSLATVLKLVEVEEQGQSSDQLVQLWHSTPVRIPWAYVRLQDIIPEQTGDSMVYHNAVTGEIRGCESHGSSTSPPGR